MRLAMTLTLGHTAIHPTKFSENWEQMVHYLGLNWCLKTCTVSMPQSKIDKALTRVNNLIRSKSLSKTQLQQVIGSLRHVCTCIPAARPFYQRLQSACNIHPGRKLSVCDDLLADCLWFRSILEFGQLQSIPVSIFSEISTPDLHRYMDACDGGLLALNMSTKQFILLEFDSIESEAILRIKVRTASGQLNRRIKRLGRPLAIEENPQNNDFSINVREFFSVVLAILIWGPSWVRPGKFFHVKAWIDNSTAVAWCNKLASPNSLAQQMLRVLGLTLARFRIHLSASHLPGGWNYIPDHGSRSMLCSSSLAIWKSFSNSWSQSHVPQDIRHLYRCKSTSFNSPLWPQPHAEVTKPPGPNGPNGVMTNTFLPNSLEPKARSPSYSSSLPPTYSTTHPIPTALHPSSPRSALLAGVIRPPLATPSDSAHDTASPLKEWLAPECPMSVPIPSHPPCSVPTTELPHVLPSATTPFGAAWSSPFSSAYVSANTLALQPKPIITCAAKMSHSQTKMAIPQFPSEKPSQCTSSSGAVKRIKPNGAAPATWTDLAIPISAQSSLRGACELLGKKWGSPPSALSVRSPTTDIYTDRYLSPLYPKQSGSQPTTTAIRENVSPHTLSEVVEPPKCISVAVVTPQSSSLADGHQMPTKPISGSRQAVISALRPK